MTTEVVSLSAMDALDLADDIMRLGRIRHMPVLESGRLVGILSQRDLFRAAVSSVLHFRAAPEREWLAKIQVREVMEPDVQTVAATTPVREAVNLMLEKRIGCLPVVSEDGDEMIGLISESDCLKVLAKLLAGDSI